MTDACWEWRASLERKVLKSGTRGGGGAYTSVRRDAAQDWDAGSWKRLKRGAAIDGAEQVVLSVATPQAAASALYRALGFQSFGCEPRALKVGERFIDQEYVVLRLKA